MANVHFTQVCPRFVLQNRETGTDGILSRILVEGGQNKNMTKTYVVINRKEEGSLKISYYVIHIARNQFYLPCVKLLSSPDYVDFLYSLIYIYMRLYYFTYLACSTSLRIFVT
jgi:hypothetical protein